jgi:transcriptional regulator with XRE-family HTH domain
MSSWFRDTPATQALLEEERLVVAATEAISEAMDRQGINKRELAERLNVRPSEISQRLSGRRNLTLRSLAAMLHAVGVRARLSIEDEQTPFVAGIPWNSTTTASQRAELSPVPDFVVTVMSIGVTHQGLLPETYAGALPSVIGIARLGVALTPGIAGGNAVRWEAFRADDGTEVFYESASVQ